MANLDIELGAELVEAVKDLAVRHYGDSGEASLSRVVESALEMRLLAKELVPGGGDEIEEPIRSWESPNKQLGEQVPGEIRDWLFRRR